MAELIFLTDPNYLGVVAFAFCITFLSWFLGYTIRLVLSLLYKIIYTS